MALRISRLMELGACRNTAEMCRRPSPLVGHLHDAGVLFGAKLVVVRVYGDTLAECCYWFLRLSIYILILAPGGVMP